MQSCCLIPPPPAAADVNSCDGGNLLLVLVSCKGELVPRVALFAARDIAAGEELTFSYGHSQLQPGADEGEVFTRCLKEGSKRSQRICLCGTAGCSGFMPTDDV
jgi:SET domain-containing protein